METKESKIARKLIKFFNSDNFEQIYYKFGKFVEKNWDYFGKLETSSLIKILFYIRSLKETGDISQANKRINNIEFINFFYNTGDKAYNTCSNCDGDGESRCEYCDGNGEMNCDDCDGDGILEIECEVCGGIGKYENGYECEDCAGSGFVDEACKTCDRGTVRCSECYGSGTEQCDVCEGDGEELTNNDAFVNYFVISWDPKFNKLTRDLIELEKPYGETEDFFIKYSNSFLILHQNEPTEYRLSDQVEVNKVYPYLIVDDNKLLSWRSGSLGNYTLPYNFFYNV